MSNDWALQCRVGLQSFVMTLNGPAVALAAQGHLLAAVWHGSLPASTDDQSLQYAVYDISQQKQARLRCPFCLVTICLVSSTSKTLIKL